MDTVNTEGLDHVVADMSYTAPSEGQANIRVFPPSSGIQMETPARERVSVPVYDCRPIAGQLTMDGAGFQLVSHRRSL